ncbi:phage host-nuclease inhibitor protein Gam [Paenibacillus sp. SORGH_AS306]|uniref:hypothetical protein n=1 Tax=unclassified Paenibacillus TaxID=185978 RepID=UPI0027813C44|nr:MULTISPECIES: hypothetical protein [unclassified Paenibacillus]MDQ1236694.1 phage host-nuclease inhibitor protein Gam [Paenibacillus sp. SORGH_AS_0306]MDR6109051.1 phage host-nuclease inhibitor protein Gam [Paenibacillus sp. SORGH_AS_0338]
MKAEAIAKAVDTAMGPITKQVGDLAAQVTELKKEEGTACDQQNTLREAIAKAMNPLTEQVQALKDEVQLIKNSRGVSAQCGTEQDDIHKSAGDVSFAGVL